MPLFLIIFAIVYAALMVYGSFMYIYGRGHGRGESRGLFVVKND